MTQCGMKCEVYSRVTGYMRPVNTWNKGKREEFKDRKTYLLEKSEQNLNSQEKNLDNEHSGIK